MKVKWKGLTSLATPNTTVSQQLTIYRKVYDQTGILGLSLMNT